MFRRILVPHDFSPHADSALDLAIEPAGASKARTRLMHIFHIPMQILSPYEIPMPPALVEEVRAAASARLEAASRGCAPPGSRATPRSTADSSRR